MCNVRLDQDAFVMAIRRAQNGLRSFRSFVESCPTAGDFVVKRLFDETVDPNTTGTLVNECDVKVETFWMVDGARVEQVEKREHPT